MKKARQARNASRNGGGNGGGRASAAVALDHATYTENPAGGSGGSGSNSGGEVRTTEEKPKIGSVSIARTWSEGNSSPIGGEITGEIIGDSSGEIAG